MQLDHPSLSKPITKFVTEFWYYAGLTITDIKCSPADALFMYSFVHTLRPDAILEIGRFKGASTVMLSKALQDIGSGHLHSVDVVDLAPDSIKTLVSGNTTLHYRSSEFLVEKNVFGDTKFKLFFVDGDHTQRMAEKDIETCITLAESEAYIMMHDNTYEPVCTAIDNMLAKHNNILSRCGNFGTYIALLKISK